MNVNKEKMNMVRFIGHTEGQLALEDDFIVPDIKPDIMQLIQESGDIKITEARPESGKIVVRGKLEFSVLYIGTDTVSRLHRMTGGIPFEETFPMEGLTESHNIKIRWDIEDLRTRMINSRKISVRSIVALNMIASATFEEEAASGNSEDADLGTYIRGKQMDFSQLHIQKRDILRVKREISLPSAKPNMLEIVWGRVTPGKIEYKVLDDHVNMKGTMQVFVMYTTTEEEHSLQYYLTEVEFNENVDTPESKEEMIGHVETKMVQGELNIQKNDDGEMRQLDMEVVLELNVAVYEEKHVCLMEDIYSNQCEYIPEKKMVSYDDILMQNQSMDRLEQTIRIENNHAKILQICQAEAHVKADRTIKNEEGILVEGVVYVQILYIAADDQKPVNSIKGIIPFSHNIEVQNMNDHCTYEVIPMVGEVSWTMIDSESIEVRSELIFNTIVFERQTAEVIANILKQPVDFKKLEKMPDIVGYIVRPGDSLWSLSKQYATTCRKIMQMNDLETEEIRVGQKLVIMRDPMTFA